MSTMNARTAANHRAQGREWFRNLPIDLKWEIGDQLVLGSFDWREWSFPKKPSDAFLNGVDIERMLWEDIGS